jgi:hypothetical protein
MTKIRYQVKEFQGKEGQTHSFYARPIFAGKMTFDELVELACRNTTYERSTMKACVEEFMNTAEQMLLLGHRCDLGQNFLTLYPNIILSVKDHEDPKTREQIVATAEMLTARNAVSRLGCTVNPKFSKKFASQVQWQKTDKFGNDVEDVDITEGNGNVEGDNPGDNSGQGNSDFEP